jgi:predicted YcjX-like family ATPase
VVSRDAWHAHLATLKPDSPEDEQAALAAARPFTDYLRSARADPYALSLLPPGRFLLPGELAGSPALTFVPLEPASSEAAPAGSLWAMMERRYEAYKNLVVRPFFHDHFARLDRQIVLVDALPALNAGPAALRDLENALTAILDCFRTGRRSFLSNMFRPRIDRILFAATKADHLHHVNHDRLERILGRMAERAMARAEFGGARIDVVALAAVRATREVTVSRGRDKLPSIVGVPIAGETAGTETFDGATEAAMFPGDLPEDPATLFPADGRMPDGARPSARADLRFLRFRPPRPEAGDGAALPHIRLDRALQFLLGDYLA